MCSPVLIPLVAGAIGIGLVKKQADKTIKKMNEANAQAAAQAAAVAPAPKVPPPPAALLSGEPLKDAAAQTSSARADAKRRAAALAGLGNTMKTGGLGVSGPAPVQGKSLLGQ